MKTPKFYYKKVGLKALLLIPLSFVFWPLSSLRNIFIKPEKLEGRFVICVGNANVGGSGKTPTCIFLADLLTDVCFVSRGYGRKTKGFIKVNDGLSVEEVGDEVKILSQKAPVYLFSKYKEIAHNLSQIKEKIIIMDDGMQNPSIKKDLTFLVVDGMLKFGNELLLPAGPLRERKASALNKASAVLYINSKEDFVGGKKPSFHLQMSFAKLPPSDEKYLAFSGLAVNEKFFSTLKSLNLNVVKFLEFEDHHPYTNSEIEDIIKMAEAENLKIITTEKDIVKIPSNFLLFISYLKLEIVSTQKEEIYRFISSAIIFNSSLEATKGGMV